MQPFVIGFCFFLLLQSASLAKDAVLRFNRDIRPILSSNCFQCHGPDKHNRKADLRLDEEEGIRTAFAANDLTDGEAWQRINSSDDDVRMPPPNSHKKLKDEEKRQIKKWIQQGAKWDGHWSFIAPVQAELPVVKNQAWIANPIDAFILSRMEEQELTPSAPAAREILLRRVTLDLTGLPPTLEEIDRFSNDESESAYETVVDRLLKSPHFGERMALVWMDLARYGDTSVFHADGPRDMWPWRDWVINAYNENKPFDQFTIEQLAGDLIPDATASQRIASGFNRNNATTDEGGAIAEEFRVEYAVDRVQTTGLVWMALSIQCAQCHEHKFDPITQREYYEFFAYFNQASDPGMQTRNGNQSPVANVFDAEKLEMVSELKPQITALDEKMRDRRSAAVNEFQQWLFKSSADAKATPIAQDDLIVYCALDEKPRDKSITNDASAANGLFHGPFQDQAGYFGRAIRVDNKSYVEIASVADFEQNDAFSYGAWVRPSKNGNGAILAKLQVNADYRGFDLIVNNKDGRIEMHLVHKWPDNAIKVVVKKKLAHDQWHHVFATYDGSSKASGAKIYVNGDLQQTEVEVDKLGDTLKNQANFAIGRRSAGLEFSGDIDEVRVYARALHAGDVKRMAQENPTDRLLVLESEVRTKAQLKELEDHYFKFHDEPFIAFSKKRTELQNQVANLEKPISTVMVMNDVAEPRMTYVLNRGSYDSPLKDQAVEPKTLSALPGMPEGAPKNRLGMAQWLVQPNHPLTARVAVNRYWYMLFGNGIVKSIDEFGSQGEWPSHPELLDWLAVDFVEHGWNVKRTIKQMVMSSTYRQCSKISPRLLAQDPQNRWLARGPRFRLAGEHIRDSALSASGLMVPKIGGPSVKPYQPSGLWNDVSINVGLRFQQDHGEALYRRSLYTYWKRSAPAPSLTIFDTPSREKCVVRRSRTNTPLQALVTLNDVQFVEASRALAERAMTQGGKFHPEWIVHAFRLATGTRPSEKVKTSLIDAYVDEKKLFEKEPTRASELLSMGESKRNEGLDQAKHAAMTIVTSIILNLDQTLTRG